MKNFSLVVAILLRATCTWATPRSVTAQTLSNIFNIDDASCNTFQSNSANTPSLQQLANEAADLANAGLSMVQSAGTVRAGEDYLINFFKTMPGDAAVQQIENVFTSVKNFLVGPAGGAIVPPGNVQKASLFCDDRGWTTVQPTDNAVQEDGSNLVNGNNQPILVQDHYRNEIAQFQSANGGTYPLILLITLPITPAKNVYVFRKPFSKSGNGCSTGDIAGTTYKARFGNGQSASRPNLEYPVILICPRSFTYGESNPLGNVAPVVGTPGTTGGQTIARIVPYSNTFLHEMFHFAPWNPPTGAIQISDAKPVLPDGSTGRPYSLSSCLQFPMASAIMNAQTYVYMAIGAWYTYYKPQSNGNLVTYATGQCLGIGQATP